MYNQAYLRDSIAKTLECKIMDCHSPKGLHNNESQHAKIADIIDLRSAGEFVSTNAQKEGK